MGDGLAKLLISLQRHLLTYIAVFIPLSFSINFHEFLKFSFYFVIMGYSVLIDEGQN